MGPLDLTPGRLIGAVRNRLGLAHRRLVHRVGAVHERVPRGFVALTFDDGPHPDWTPEVLRILRDRGVVATFFCVGANARQHPELLRLMVVEGHAVGSHSETHRVDGAATPFRAFRDFARGRKSVEAATQRAIPLFRAPHGRLGLISAALCRRSGLHTWHWTIDAADWTAGLSADVLVERFVSRTRGGDVILMHDRIEEPLESGAEDRAPLLDALPRVIDELRQAGLEFVALR